MYTFVEFAADVSEVFRFLESEHGMRPTVNELGVGAWVTYENATARVIVHYEIGAGVWTSIEDLTYQRKVPDTSRTFSIRDLAPPGKHYAETSRDAVFEQASLLREHGSAVLRGDFASLHAKHDRLVSATLANRRGSV